jgi:hypothetical protein
MGIDGYGERKERTPRVPLSPLGLFFVSSFHSSLGAGNGNFCWKHGRDVYKKVNNKQKYKT